MANVTGSTGIQPSTHIPDSSDDPARCSGMPRKRSYGTRGRPRGGQPSCGVEWVTIGAGATRCHGRRRFDDRVGRVGRWWIGIGIGVTSEISERSRRPRSVRKSCDQERGLVWRGRTLEGELRDADDDPSASEGLPHFSQRARGGHRADSWPSSTSPGVAAGLRSAPRTPTEDISLVRAAIGLDPSRVGIDPTNRVLQNSPAA